MKKGYREAAIALLYVLFSVCDFVRASEFQYPYYLIGSHRSTSECWTGIGKNGNFPLSVDPNEYLVGAPPSIENSAVTIPIDCWIELLFRGVIYDGPGYDIFVSEMDPVGEQALVFLTDGGDQEYLLALAEVPNTNVHLPTILGFDIAGLVLPFEPRAVRVVGIDLRGGSPGFDLSFVNARIYQGDDKVSRYPYPPDKAENVPMDTVLDWLPGSDADKYKVYFGKDIYDVYPGANTVPNPMQPQEPNSFDPNTLELGKTYYWRIDDVNDTDPNSPLTGTVWSFSVSNNFVIDDFESYNSEYVLSDRWVLEELGLILLRSQSSPVHSCRYSMEIGYYYNDAQKTLVTHSFNEPHNWISAGVKSIDIFFHGHANNDVNCSMYIALGDGNSEIKIPYNEDINDITDESWHCWRINLQSPGLLPGNEEQIDFSNIKYFSIGFDKDPNHADSDGYGTVYVDDIKLYPSRCLAENRPEADFNGDCIVDFKDFDELAYNWLETGYNIYQVKEPDNAPILWYEFENDLVDTIGNAHGEVNGGTPDYVPGVFGQAISFNGYQDTVKVYPVSHIFSKIEKGITIAFWQKGDDSPYKRDTLFCSEYEYNVSDPAISINLGCWYGTGIYNWDCGTHQPYDRRLTGTHRYIAQWANQWNHWAFTKDIKTGVMQVFLNGVLINSRNDSCNMVSVIDSFSIGMGWYGGYDGLIDDLGIYDYALSQPEIACIATHGTGIFDINLMTPADLQPDNIIDFNDLFIFAGKWLDNRLFPSE
ncbi:MAG: LamG domain-containing protein [Sedimentisphaerales bacterium]|nr:LamG domain-containing protein [Sedimentisphaerales bacterium]